MSNLVDAPGLAPKYAQVSTMRPYDAIPSPTPAAQESAVSNYKSMLESAPGLVQEFEARFDAWKRSWYASENRTESK